MHYEPKWDYEEDSSPMPAPPSDDSSNDGAESPRPSEAVPRGETREVRHRRRVGAEECHYNGYLMSGAHILQFVSDASGELQIRNDGEGGLLAAIKSAEFYEPVYAGETLEIVVRLVRKGNRSRHLEFEVYKHIRKRFDQSASAAEVVDPPQLVANGAHVAVVGAAKAKRPDA